MAPRGARTLAGLFSRAALDRNSGHVEEPSPSPEWAHGLLVSPVKVGLSGTGGDTGLGARDTPMPPAGAARDDLVSTLAGSLYHSLLARDPNDAERATLAKLAVDGAGNPVDRGNFAKLACFAVAITSEFLLY